MNKPKMASTTSLLLGKLSLALFYYEIIPCQRDLRSASQKPKKKGAHPPCVDEWAREVTGWLE